MIEWTVYGKISHIEKINGGTTTHIYYTYDASGNRISKNVTSGGATATTKTIYVRDASGNVMSIYEKLTPAASPTSSLTQTEVSMYGSSRLGVYNVNRVVTSLAPIDYSNYSGNFIRGNKFFELSNHLGNVLVTISDKHIGVPCQDGPGPIYACPALVGGNTAVGYYLADVVTANDYYPGGMTMPGRKFTQANSGYRYGFNGKEKTAEITNDNYDYGARIYDGRLGRWLAVDPLQKKYPDVSPYTYCLNNVILFIDPNGKEVIIKDANNKVVATVKADGKMIIRKGMENSSAIHAYNEAKAYLKGSSTSLSTLETHKKITYFKIVNTTIDGGALFTPQSTYADLNGNKILDKGEIHTYKPDLNVNGTITWNPNQGIKDDEKNIHSPALTLEHEEIHAVRNLTDAVSMAFDALTPDPKDPKGNVEETRTIKKTNVTSIKLNNGDGGFGGRQTHGGVVHDADFPSQVGMNKKEFKEFSKALMQDALDIKRKADKQAQDNLPIPNKYPFIKN